MRVQLLKDCKVNNVLKRKNTLMDLPLTQAKALVFSGNAKTVCALDEEALARAEVQCEPELLGSVQEPVAEVTETPTESADNNV